jgi:hypothetical protein
MDASFLKMFRKNDYQKQNRGRKIERPLKDRLLLQGPNRGFFAAEDTHFYTSIFMDCPMNAKVMSK